MGASFDKFLSEGTTGQPAPAGTANPSAQVAPVLENKATSSFDKFLSESPVPEVVSQPPALINPAVVGLVARKGADLTPENAAQILDINKRTGLPLAFIERNLKGIQGKESQAKAFTFVQDNPVTGRWLTSSPVNFSLGRDDWPTLQKIEKLGQAGMQGLTFLPKALGALGRAVDDISAAINPNIPTGHGENDLYAIADRAEKYWSPDVDKGTAMAYATDIVRTLSQMGSTAVIGGAGGMLPLMASGSGLQKYEEARQGGASIGRSAVAGGLQGGLEYATELKPIEILTKPGMEFARRLAEGLVYDIGGELVATIGEMKLIDEKVLGKSYTTEQYVQAIKDTIIVAGGVTGAATVGAHVMDRVAQDPKPIIDNLGDLASNSQLIKRSPVAFEDLVAHATTGTDFAETHIPVETWDTYWQEKGLDPREMAQEITGSTEAYDTAAMESGDIVMSTAQYARRIAPTEHNAFFADKAKLKAVPTPMDTAATQISRAVTKGLINTGMNKAEARVQGEALYGTAFKNLGERTGINPVDLFNKYNLKIMGASMIGIDVKPIQANWRGELTLSKSERSSLSYARSSIDEGEAGYRLFIDQTEMSYESSKDLPRVIGVSSTFPAYFTNKGYTKKESLRLIDKALAGEILTGKQRAIVNDMNEGVRKELADRMVEYRSDRPVSQEARDARAADMEHEQKVAEAVGAMDIADAIKSEKALMGGSDSFEQAGKPAPPFYSKLQQTLGAKMDKTATVEQVRGLIKEMKAEEVQWSGIDEFLKDKEKVSKTELLDYLRANDLQVQEVMKGADGSTLDQPKFAKWQIPGGENYRELLLTLPVKEMSEKIVGFKEAKSLIKNGGQVKLSGSNALISTIEELQQYPDDEQFEISKSLVRGDTFKSTHFTEPNILAHVRFNDRTDAEGKSILFLEEVQSDWHQKGRKLGYEGDKPAYTELPEGYAVKSKLEGDEKTSAVYRYWVEDAGGNKIVADSYNKESAINIAINELNDRARGTTASPVPEAPFKNTWHEFALKRMLRYAAENGYDKIAWTTGEQQAERYDLSKQVGEIIFWGPEINGEFQPEEGQVGISIYDKQDNAIIEQEIKTHAELENLVGKDLAKRIIAGDAPQRKGDSEGVKHLSGLDLKVGGEGMKGFYDKIIPDFLNKFGKKYGTKVETDKIVIQEDESMNSPVLAITPALHDAALNEGFSLFQKTGRKGQDARGRITFTPQGVNIELLKNANRSTFIHETGHFYLKVMGDLAGMDGAKSGIKADYKVITDWLGAKEGERITGAQHEQWARGLETYLMEGKAPSVALRSAFSRFKVWLTEVYHKLTALNVELTPEVRDVMDRIFASDTDILAAKAEAEAAAIDYVAEGKNLEDITFADLVNVIHNEGTKSIIRRMTGLKDTQKMIGEDVALSAAWKKAEQASRVAFKEGQKAGVETQRKKAAAIASMKDMQLGRNQQVDALVQEFNLSSQDIKEALNLNKMLGMTESKVGLMTDEEFKSFEEHILQVGMAKSSETELNAQAKADNAKAYAAAIASMKDMQLGRNQQVDALVQEFNLSGQDIKEALNLNKMFGMTESKVGLMTDEEFKSFEEHILQVGMAKSSETELNAQAKADNAKAYMAEILARAQERKALRDSIAKLKKTVDRLSESPSVSGDYRAKIKAVMDGYELSGHTQATISQLEATQAYLDKAVAAGEDVTIPQRVLDKLQILGRIPKEELTLSQVQGLQNEIDLLAKLGKTKWASKEALYDAEKQERKNALLESASPILSSQLPSAPIGSEPRVWAERYIWLRNYLQKSRLALKPIDGLADITGMHKMKSTLDLNYGAYLTYNDSAFRAWHELTKDFVQGNFERIGAVAIARQDGGIERLANSGRTEADINAIKLTAQEEAAYRFVRDTFEGEFPAVRKYALDVYNEDVGQVKNYVSFMSDNNAMSDLEMYERFGQRPEEIVNLRTKTVEQGFRKKRAAVSKIKPELNIDKIFRRHMDDVAWMLTMGKDIKQYSEIVNSPEMKTKLGDIGALAWLQWLDLMARKGRADSAKRIAALDYMRRKVGAGVLAFRLSSALVQFTSFADTMGTIGAEWATKGAASIATSKEWRNFVMDNFAEVNKAVGDDVAFREFGEGMFAKATRVGMTPLQFLDGLMRSTAAAGAYQKLAAERGVEIDLTKPDKVLIEEATKLMRESQGSSFFKDQPLGITTGFGLAENHSVNKTILQFQSFMLSRWDNIQRQVWRLGIKEKDYGKAAMSFFWMVIVAAAMEEGLRRTAKAAINLVTGDKSGTQDSFAKETLLNTIQNVPLLGQIISSMTYASNPVPVVKAIDEAIKGGSAVAKAKTPKAKARGAVKAIGAVGTLAGVPGSSQGSQIIEKALSDKNRR